MSRLPSYPPNDWKPWELAKVKEGKPIRRRKESGVVEGKRKARIRVSSSSSTLHHQPKHHHKLPQEYSSSNSNKAEEEDVVVVDVDAVVVTVEEDKPIREGKTLKGEGDINIFATFVERRVTL